MVSVQSSRFKLVLFSRRVSRRDVSAPPRPGSQVVVVKPVAHVESQGRHKPGLRNKQDDFKWEISEYIVEAYLKNATVGYLYDNIKNLALSRAHQSNKHSK